MQSVTADGTACPPNSHTRHKANNLLQIKIPIVVAEATTQAPAKTGAAGRHEAELEVKESGDAAAAICRRRGGVSESSRLEVESQGLSTAEELEARSELPDTQQGTEIGTSGGQPRQNAERTDTFEPKAVSVLCNGQLQGEQMPIRARPEC